MIHYIYLHGFGSSPTSKKGVIFVKYLKEKYNIQLHIPDLNVPSFSKLSCTQALLILDTLIKSIIKNNDKICLIGSSMGGYIATVYAQYNPEKIDKLILLSPAFGIKDRWLHHFGSAGLENWKQTGFKEFINFATGEPTQVHYKFIEDSETLPPYPNMDHLTLIIHGTNDQVIPIQVIKEYAKTRKNVVVKEVTDDHELLQSVDFIKRELDLFFNLST